MRFWREVMADRYSGGLLGVLLMLSVAVQAVLTGWTAAAMAAPDPLSFICAPSPGGDPRPAEPDRQHDCPCGLLCGAGAHAQDVSPPAVGSGIPIRFANRVDVALDRSAAIVAGPVAGPHRARGPPRSST